ncbi:MAG TPA: tRNA (adenosine(37)-N6)-threonylcarbamoyltransferase complex transferase subunit TsaD [Patescibacteria group bacterium]|jgi:N6-L-threonylcarbamoyladenine synthase|nr:tRNA (adenosine(37)-N6)-threonylcarbamoyltransferase complex transferase subunit TsaD [Patescibacteria group bacterium]
MKKSLKILAIETSCDETAAAVIIDGKIKSNIIASQAKLHSKFGGVVPEVAAREHVPTIIPVIDKALKSAGVKLNQIDVIAVTRGPGLITSLIIGVETAQVLGNVLNKPVMGINHLEAHIYANFVDKKINFPALGLVVSGGHTLMVLMKNHGDYKIIGETVDDAAGEAFDKTAKLLKLGYPGGPQISKLAKIGKPKAFNFPRPMLNSPDFNFSFSGLKTAVLYELLKHKTAGKKLKADMAASLQQAIVETLIGKLERAAIKFKPRTMMLGGGVAANELLRQEFIMLSKKLKIKASIPKLEYCTDNAAMIGLAAHYRLMNEKSKQLNNFTADPNLPLK